MFSGWTACESVVSMKVSMQSACGAVSGQCGVQYVVIFRISRWSVQGSVEKQQGSQWVMSGWTESGQKVVSK